ncbi:MAG: S1 RNA-binding domain-containing protein, partial [bacterium]
IVEFGPNKDGMVHISQIAQDRVNNVEDFLELGQEVFVKVLKIDERGRVNLSIRAVTPEDIEQANAAE